MHNMMDKKQMGLYLGKLHIKRNIFFKAFFLNLILVFLFWVLSLTSFYTFMMAFFVDWPPMQIETYIYDLLGIWEILNVTFFLVPALAIWWEMYACKKLVDQEDKQSD